MPVMGSHSFCIDPHLLVVVIPCEKGGSLHDTAFVVPASDIPSVTTASSDRGDPATRAAVVD